MTHRITLNDEELAEAALEYARRKNPGLVIPSDAEAVLEDNSATIEWEATAQQTEDRPR